MIGLREIRSENKRGHELVVLWFFSFAYLIITTKTPPGAQLSLEVCAFGFAFSVGLGRYSSIWA